MALTTIAEIKQEIIDNLEQFTELAHPEDLLSEFADSRTPIYNNDIIAEWTEMPSRYDDTWKDYVGPDSFKKDGIFRFMAIDLYAYYVDLYSQAWAEIQAEGIGVAA